MDKVTVTAGLYWTVFECGLGLIAACMPAIYVLWKRLLGTYKGRSGQRTNESLWSWRTISSKSKKPNPTDLSTSDLELELVPPNAPFAMIDTRVFKDHCSEYDENIGKHSEGIMVSKTVRRAEVVV